MSSRRQATRRALAASCALAIVLLPACSGSDSSSPPSTTAFGSNVTKPPATAPKSTAPDPAGLGGHVPSVGGLVPVTGANADNGPFELNTAVRKYNSNDAEARQRLTDDGFVGGYASTFQGEGNTTAGIQVYKLRDQAAATDFAEYLKEHAMQGVPNFNLSVGGVPGLTGFVQPQVLQGQPTPGTIAGAMFVKGPYLAYIGATSPATDVGATIQSLTKAQYDSLPAPG